MRVWPFLCLTAGSFATTTAYDTQEPETHSVPELAKQFGVSVEAVKRILHSKWSPKSDGDGH